MKVDLTCPLELWEYHLPALQQDEADTVVGDATPPNIPDAADESPPVPSSECVLTLFNLENRAISSMQVSLTALDAAGEPIVSHTERPMALAAQGKQSFELRFEIGKADAMDSLSLLFEKVWFEDGTVWRRASSAQLTDYTPNELPGGRELENLRYVAGPDAVGFPDDQGKVWMCVCGRANAEDEDTCRRCGRSREYIFLNYTTSSVKDAITTRERELEQKGQKAREESSRQELLRQVAIRRRDSSHKLRWVGAAVVSAMIVALYFAMALLLPELTYARAVQAMAAGSPITAKEIFVSLMDYRDSEQQVIACDYAHAQQLLTKGDMDSVTLAQSLFDELGSYKDARVKVSESRYSQAALFLSYGEYERAAALFAALGSYSDAQAQYRLSSYRQARRMMTAQQYEAAAALFSELGAYEDSADMAMQCVYRAATAAMAASKFDEAAALYASIEDYQDASSRAQEALYSAGGVAMTSGGFAAARGYFGQLGEYRDALGKWKEATYAEASKQRDMAKYAEALALFIEIKDYEDAADQILACSYEPARSFMAAGQYEQAARLLAAMPEYKDSAELLNQCSYLPAMDAFTAEKWAEAIALFSKAPEYKDSATRADTARYNIAAGLLASGDRKMAAEAFEALGDFKDAKAQAQSTRYALAEDAFIAGQYEAARTAFEALGTYSNAASRAKECSYTLAMKLKDSGDLEGAYTAFMAIKEYPPAVEAAAASQYAMAVISRNTGDLTRAAEQFLKAGNYKDARDQRDQVIYEDALLWMEQLDYQRAGALFDSITHYSDAKARSAQCYDLWLADRLADARALEQSGELREVVDMLAALPLDELPASYSAMREMYEKANLAIADQLISVGQQLEAWTYLTKAGTSAEAKRLRERRVYQILGEWENSREERFAFREDGTAMLADEDGYYFNVANWGLLTGTSPDDLSQTYQILHYTADTLSLKDKDGRNIKLTRAALDASAVGEGEAIIE